MALTIEDLRTATSEQLLAFTKRRHPDFADKIEHWRFLDLSYRGGREWIDKNIFTYHKEGKKEYRDRKRRAYRFPHAKEVVSLVNKYVFKGDIARRDDVPGHIKEFWGAATLFKRPIADLMEMISAQSSTFGRVWVVVDNNVAPDVVSEADRKRTKGRTYAYFLKPTQVYDFEYDDDGELEWFMNGEFIRDTSNPVNSEGKIRERFRIWTKDFTVVIEVKGSGHNKVATLEASTFREHRLGLVPVFPADHITVDDLYSAPALIEDVAYLDRAVANYLSNLDVIIQDQTFSQLVIPFQSMLPSGGSGSLNDEDDEGSDEMNMLVQMGTKRVFGFNAEGGQPPSFISPDVKQAGLIMSAITKLVGEIYHSIGMSGERTKEDNAQGIDNSSGVAKAYDFEKLNSMLAAKARSLENIEKNLVRMVNAWRSDLKELEKTEDYVTYPKTFDVRNLSSEMDDAQRLGMIDAPKELRRKQMIRLARKMFPQATEEAMKAIEKEIQEDWLEIEEEVLAAGLAGGFPSTGRVPGKKNSQGENNKGSVKADDKTKADKPKPKPNPAAAK